MQQTDHDCGSGLCTIIAQCTIKCLFHNGQVWNSLTLTNSLCKVSETDKAGPGISAGKCARPCQNKYKTYYL